MAFKDDHANGKITHSLLEVGDKVVPVLGLLETSERHLGSRNVLLRVLKVLEEGLVVLNVSSPEPKVAGRLTHVTPLLTLAAV